MFDTELITVLFIMNMANVYNYVTIGDYSIPGFNFAFPESASKE